MSKPIINETVEIILDENNRPSCDPMDTVRFGQQLLLKALIGKTDGGNLIPTDTTEMQSLIRDLNTTALLSRKLDIEESAGAVDGKRIAEAYAEHKRQLAGKPLPLPDANAVNPLDVVQPPEVELSDGEALQGQQIQVAEDYLQSN